MKQEISTRHWKIWCYLGLLDILGAFAGFSSAYGLRISSGLIPYSLDTSFSMYLPLFFFSLVPFLLIMHGVGLYDRRNLFWGTEEYMLVFRACSYFVFSIIFISFFTRDVVVSRGWIISTWVLSILAVCAGRAFFRQYLRMLSKKGRLLDRVVILGASEASKAMAQQLETSGMVSVAGFLDDYNPSGTEVLPGKRILGPSRLFREIASREGANLAIVVPDAICWETRRNILKPGFSRSEPEIQIASEASSLSLMNMRVSFRGGIPLLRFKAGYTGGMSAVVKLVIDYALCLCMIPFAAPVMLTIALLLFIERKGPAIERFQVWGRDGGVFQTYKFRTGLATLKAYRSFRKKVQPRNNGRPMSPIEFFLFQSGLDKLPQLFNVLAGQMSLVGPRTIPVETAGANDAWLPVVLAVKPGIMGNWALREARDMEQEISVTLYYVRHWNVWMDLVIMCQTLFELVRTRMRSRIEKSPPAHVQDDAVDFVFPPPPHHEQQHESMSKPEGLIF